VYQGVATLARVTFKTGRMRNATESLLVPAPSAAAAGSVLLLLLMASVCVSKL